MMNTSIGLSAPVLSLLAFSAVYNPWTLRFFPKTGWAALATSPQAFFLVASGLIIWWRRLTLDTFGLNRRAIRPGILWGLGLGMSPILLTAVIAGILSAMDSIHSFLPRPFLGGLPIAVDISKWNLVSLLILAPLSEELFFRGILLRGLREAYSPFWSVALSSVIFMGAHGGFKPGPLILGLIAAPVAFRTHSILAGILFHAISNAYGPAMLTWFPNLYRYLDFFYR